MYFTTIFWNTGLKKNVFTHSWNDSLGAFQIENFLVGICVWRFLCDGCDYWIFANSFSNNRSVALNYLFYLVCLNWYFIYTLGFWLWFLSLKCRSNFWIHNFTAGCCLDQNLESKQVCRNIFRLWPSLMSVIYFCFFVLNICDFLPEWLVQCTFQFIMYFWVWVALICVCVNRMHL